MNASLISRLAAHVAATRDAPTPADQLIAEALEALEAVHAPLTYDDCRFYVTTAPDDDGNLESCLHDRLTSRVLESSRDDTYCHDQARWLNTLDAPRAMQIEQLKQAMQWRPIAEAPHNGNSVLVRGRFDSMWVEHVFDGEDFCEGATHFMLLPSPPERDDG